MKNMLSHVHLLVPTSLRPVQRLKDMGLEQFRTLLSLKFLNRFKSLLISQIPHFNMVVCTLKPNFQNKCSGWIPQLSFSNVNTTNFGNI